VTHNADCVVKYERQSYLKFYSWSKTHNYKRRVSNNRGYVDKIKCRFKEYRIGYRSGETGIILAEYKVIERNRDYPHTNLTFVIVIPSSTYLFTTFPFFLPAYFSLIISLCVSFFRFYSSILFPLLHIVSLLMNNMVENANYFSSSKLKSSREVFTVYLF
jgi:hypothetical protein